MRRVSFVALLSSLLLVTVGCSVAPPSIACDVETNTRRGRGVIVGPKTVLTVGHVVQDADEVTVDDMPARVVSRHDRKTETGQDGIAVLELIQGEFPPERVAILADHPNPGIKYLPKRGEHAWPWGLEPGDSGSPILDAQGRVTGLVRAVYGRAEPLDEPTVVAITPRAGDS